MMKKGYNIIIVCLIILMAVYCGVYWVVNRNDTEAGSKTELLVEENSDAEDVDSEKIDDIRNQEEFINIFAEVSSGGSAGEQNVKLFVSGKNGYFFVPSYCTLNNIRLSFDENQYELFIDDKAIQSGSSFHADSAASYEMIIRKSDGTQDAYLLSVMQSANLPSIFISTANSTMGYVNDKKGNYEPGYFVCVDSTGNTDCEMAFEKIKLHGFTSLSVPKKTYQVDFSEAGDLLDMGNAVHWILQANAYDKSYMRNKLVYDLFQCMESAYAVEGEYADVYFNGEYAGNYLVCEKVEAGINRIAFSDSIGYDADENAAPGQIAEEENMRYFDSEEQDTDIGYLIEAQNILVSSDLLRMSEDDCFFVSDSGRYEVKWPEAISKTQMVYIREYMQQIEQMIYHCSTDADYHELNKYIDTDSFAVMYLMNILTNDVDANAYSTFYYKFPESNDGKMYAGPVWDYDRAFGNEERNVNVSVNGYTDSLCEALYKNAQFRNRVQELFNERFVPVSDNVIQTYFEMIPEMLSQSVDMDAMRWQSNFERLNYSYNSFRDETAYLKYYYHERMKIVSEIVNETGMYHMISFVNPEGQSRSCFIKDGEFLTAEVLSLMRTGLKCDTWTLENGSVYQQGRPIFGDMVLYGRIEDDE